MDRRSPTERLASSETLIFVYGTLLSGEPNHHFLRRARFVGPARTAPEFDLVDLGGFPGLVSGGQTAVAGELYALGPEALEALDELEDHPDYYRRTPIELEDGTRSQSYLLPRTEAGLFPRIPSGDWRAAHGEA